MKLLNETTYPTRTLRAMVTAAHRRLAKTEGRLPYWRGTTFSVLYGRVEGRGRAAIGGVRACLWLPRGGARVEIVAHLIEHEMLHLYGHSHKHARGHGSFTGRYDDAVVERDGAWARALWGDVLLEAVPTTKPRVPVRELRRERVLARLATWEQRLKRAQRIVSKLRQKARYYERRQAAAAPAVRP